MASRSSHDPNPIAHLLAPLKKGTRDYLLRVMVPSLVEGLTQLSIHRPEDPHRWMAEFLLSKSRDASRLEITERTTAEGADEGSETKLAESNASAARLTVSGMDMFVQVEHTADGATIRAVRCENDKESTVLRLTAEASRTLPDGLQEAQDDATHPFWKELQSRLTATTPDGVLRLKLGGPSA